MDVEGQVESTPEAEEVPKESSWLDSITDETLRGHAENKGWTSPEEAIKSYVNAEKLLGAPKEKLLRLPDEQNSETMKDIFNALGRPADLDGYEISPADENSKWFTDAFLDIAHKAGLTKDQAQALDKWSQETSEKIATDEAEKQKIARAIDEVSLRSEWGVNYDKNLSLARHGAKQLGVDEETVTAIEQAMGYKKTMEIFANAGSKFGEHEFKTGEGASPAQYSPQGAKAELDRLMSDAEWLKKIQSGDSGAIKRHSQLVQMMASGG